MLNSNNLKRLIDYPVSKEVFPNVEVKGGICFFLWTGNHNDKCDVTVIRGEDSISSTRDLREFDVFVRDARAAEILRKVMQLGEDSITNILTPDTPFGVATNFENYHKTKTNRDIEIYYVKSGKRNVAFVSRDIISKNIKLIDSWKLFVPEAGSDGGQKIPDSVLGKPWRASPGSICTQSFLAFFVKNESELRSIESYYKSKFFRHLVSLRKVTQHALRSTYSWVPLQSWDRVWTDKELYIKYKLTQSEIEYIESVIRPMDV